MLSKSSRKIIIPHKDFPLFFKKENPAWSAEPSCTLVKFNKELSVVDIAPPAIAAAAFGSPVKACTAIPPIRPAKRIVLLFPICS